MVFRNTLFRRQVAKHRALVLIVSAHTTKTFGNVLTSHRNLLFQQRLKAGGSQDWLLHNLSDRRTYTQGATIKSAHVCFFVGGIAGGAGLRGRATLRSGGPDRADRKSTRLNSSHLGISY